MLLEWIKKYWSNLLMIVFAAGGIAAAFYMASFFKSEEQGVRSQKPIIFCQPQNALPEQQKCFFTSHIDVYLTIKVWGEEKTLPFEKGDLVKSHLHAEKNKIHWHSLISVDPKKKELEDKTQLTLGQALDDLGIPFDKDHLYNFKNGETGLNGKSGILKILVNGQSNFEFRDYVRKPEDHIDLIFDDTQP